MVHLGQLVLGRGEPLHQRPDVRQQQRPRRVLVQPPHRSQGRGAAPHALRQQVEHGFAVRFAAAAHVAGRLVQQQQQPAGVLQRAAVDEDGGGRKLGAGRQAARKRLRGGGCGVGCGGRRPGDTDAAGGHQRARLAAAAVAAAGEERVEAHERLGPRLRRSSSRGRRLRRRRRRRRDNAAAAAAAAATQQPASDERGAAGCCGRPGRHGPQQRVHRSRASSTADLRRARLPAAASSGLGGYGCDESGTHQNGRRCGTRRQRKNDPPPKVLSSQRACVCERARTPHAQPGAVWLRPPGASSEPSPPRPPRVLRPHVGPQRRRGRAAAEQQQRAGEVYAPERGAAVARGGGCGGAAERRRRDRGPRARPLASPAPPPRRNCGA